MMKFSALFIFLFYSSIFYAQETVMYRLILTDKGVSEYSIDEPEKFLSQKSIDRRMRQGFSIDETDLPISPTYFDALIEAGASIQTYSKWVKTVVVTLDDEESPDIVKNLPFVAECYPVFRGLATYSREKERKGEKEEYPVFTPENGDFDDYGDAWTQISLSNGHLLHNRGFKGNDITIAVLDGGFRGANAANYFDHSKILGVKNFTHQNENLFYSSIDHGTKVLSCMLTNNPSEMIGTAPEASYYLFKTEVNGSEFPVEEDYWIAAVEYADSLGVDIVSTSLGYFTFDDPNMNHVQMQLDGETVPISRAASMAAYKGMILCNSAGNERVSDWRKIIFPADAKNILTVGAIAGDSSLAYFSSVGYTSDERVKPDIMAMGLDVTVIGAYGKEKSNGTSFSCPIISGLTASLWQALPSFNSLKLMDLIRKSADRYQNPDGEYGYGIPDYFKAYTEGLFESLIPSKLISDHLVFDSKESRIYVRGGNDSQTRLSIYTSMGIKVLDTRMVSDYLDVSYLNKGIYIVCFQNGNKQYTGKFVIR